MIKQHQALPQTQQWDALCIPSSSQGKEMLIPDQCGSLPLPSPTWERLSMEEAFPFSPLPLNAGNAVSTEPITAERMAGSVDGLAEEWGWVAKRGTSSWQGGLLQQCCCRAASSSIHAGPCHKQKELLEKLPLGTRKYSSKRDKSSASHTETTSPQIKPPLPRTKVPSRELLKALFLSPVLLVIFNY